jgi:hypothetical protein
MIDEPRAAGLSGVLSRDESIDSGKPDSSAPESDGQIAVTARHMEKTPAHRKANVEDTADEHGKRGRTLSAVDFI